MATECVSCEVEQNRASCTSDCVPIILSCLANKSVTGSNWENCTTKTTTTNKTNKKQKKKKRKGGMVRMKSGVGVTVVINGKGKLWLFSV